MRTYRYKLYASKRNRFLSRQIHIAGIIWNHCLALQKRYYRLFHNYIPLYQLHKHITKLKKLEKHSFWFKLGSQAIQEIAERLDKAYQRFFKYCKTKSGPKCRPPKFKKVKRFKSFTLKQAGWKLDDSTLVINKKRYKFSKSREIEGDIKTVNIKRDAVGDFWVSFSCKVEFSPENRIMTGKAAGFDFGLKTFLTSSEDTKPIKSPLMFLKNLKQVKEANRNLSRKKKGSANRKRARLQLARTHRRIQWSRHDYQWKLTRSLSREYDHVFLEDLHLNAMKKLWGRKISDLAFDSFVKKLESKAEENGCEVVFVDRFFPSSKKCSQCDNVKETLSLKERVFRCECGFVLDRDKNAALNIKMEGASSIGLEVCKTIVDGGLVGARA